MPSSLIDTASSGDVTITAAPSKTGQFIRVLGYVLLAGGADSVYFANGNDSLKLTGTYNLAAQAGVAAAVCDQGWFDLSANTSLLLNKAAAVQVSGHVRYELKGG